ELGRALGSPPFRAGAIRLTAPSTCCVSRIVSAARGVFLAGARQRRGNVAQAAPVAFTQRVAALRTVQRGFAAGQVVAAGRAEPTVDAGAVFAPSHGTTPLAPSDVAGKGDRDHDDQQFTDERSES